ncbi:hypothetical protein [Owenweeksia hongkongensis]|uniref:hypothetical protein n=1 Tax=Owenweeksia hongkongensis TaxID=253245 RepID=UPI003A8D1EFA
MIEVDLLKIIETGFFGPVSIDDRRERLISVIGEPEHADILDVQEVDHYEVLNYNWWEFTFYNGHLYRYQNKCVLDGQYKFDPDFLSAPENFKIIPWFNNWDKDTLLKPFKGKLEKSDIEYKEEPFYDSIRLLIDYKDSVIIEIQFHCEKAYGHNPDEWLQFSDGELDWKFGALYVTKKINSNNA